VEFMENHEKAIIVSKILSRDELYKLMLMFRAEQKKRFYIDYLKHPKNILRKIYHAAKNSWNTRVGYLSNSR